jgi:hypothetical protein
MVGVLAGEFHKLFVDPDRFEADGAVGVIVGGVTEWQFLELLGRESLNGLVGLDELQKPEEVLQVEGLVVVKGVIAEREVELH